MKNKKVYPMYVDMEKSFQVQEGMTLLEHYAGLAMQGILAHQTEEYGCSSENGAKLAVQWSKALIEELQKQSNDND